MAFEPGKPRHPGAGRKKGSLNKKNRTIIEMVEASGLDPIEVMLKLMADPDKSIAMMAAKEVAQYIYSKRPQGIHVSGSLTPSMQREVEELSGKTDQEIDLIIEAEYKLLRGGDGNSGG